MLVSHTNNGSLTLLDYDYGTDTLSIILIHCGEVIVLDRPLMKGDLP